MPLLFFILIIMCHSVHSVELRFAYGPGNGPPFSIMENGELSSGIFKDMGEALAHTLEIPVTFHHAPQNRVSLLLEAGEINTVCMTHPDWIDQADRYFWSDIIAKDYDHLISLKQDDLTVAKLDDLFGSIIGAMTGYIYNDGFMDMVEQGKATRRNFNNLQSLYASLFAERVDLVVDSLISVTYRKKTIPSHKDLNISTLKVYQYDLFCVFGEDLKPMKKRILTRLNRLSKQNKFENIIKAYR